MTPTDEVTTGLLDFGAVPLEAILDVPGELNTLVERVTPGPPMVRVRGMVFGSAI